MIKIENVSKRYGDFELKIDFSIPKGRVCGIVGKNGAGKSTTIKLLLNLIRPDKGRVLVFDKDVADLTNGDKEKIGVCLSDSFFSSILTINDIEAILKKTYKNFDDTYFKDKCLKLSLPKDKSISEFSTGMKAKIKALCALSHHSSLLIMDEPTSGLDVEARNEILDMMREYMREDENRSIILTSHISSDLESICDDITLIDSGNIIFHEDTDVILDSYCIIKTDETKFDDLEKEYLLETIKTRYGYACLSNQRQFFMENHKELTIERCGIDDLLLIKTGGYR